MSRLPDAIFVVDTRKEKIAVDEARKLKIPVIGIVDTNCDPDEVDYVIPGNDDALRAIRLFASKIADAVTAGRGMRESRIAEEDAAKAEEAAAADAAARLTRAVRPQRREPTPDAGRRIARPGSPVQAPASNGRRFSCTGGFTALRLSALRALRNAEGPKTKAESLEQTRVERWQRSQRHW